MSDSTPVMVHVSWRLFKVGAAEAAAKMAEIASMVVVRNCIVAGCFRLRLRSSRTGRKSVRRKSGLVLCSLYESVMM